jgi:hypothetical protein
MSKKTNVNVAICLLPGLRPLFNGGAELVEYDECEDDEDEDILVAIKKELAEVRKMLEKQGAELAELKQKGQQQNPG